jgi:elongation factor 1-gamma
MALTVYTTAGNPRLFKAKIAAQYTGVKINEIIVDMKAGDNKKPEYLAKFPLGKVPSAETAEGLPLVESGAIARHVARINPSAGLFGASFYQGSLVDQWIDFASFEIEALGPKWLWMVRGYYPYNAETFNQGKEAFAKVAKVLDNHLIANTFVTGDTITLADITLFCVLYSYFTNVITQAVAEKEWPSIVRWWNTLAIQPQFKAVVPNPEFVKAEVFPAGHPSYVAPAGAAATPAPAVAPKEEKKAAAPAPTPEPTPVAASPEPKKGKGKKEPEAKKEATPAPVAAAPVETPKSPEPKKGGKPKAEAATPTPASPKVEAKKAPEPKKSPEPKAEAPKASPKAAAQPKAKAASGKKK